MDKVQTINKYFIIKKINAEVCETIKSDNFITFKIQLDDITQYKKFNKTMEKELSYILGMSAILKVAKDITIIINTREKTNNQTDGIILDLGRTTLHDSVLVNFSKNPHWLIGGATGSGKSVFLNNVINDLLKYYKNDVQFMFIDLKIVEFSKYENLEQNIAHVANDLKSAIDILDNAIDLMIKRYKKYKDNKCLNIESYNEKQTDGKKDRYTFVIIDELAELMLLDKATIQDKLQRLLQLGRAAGVYVISATQRPDSNVLAGTLKVNYTTRICFKVSSVYDSKTVINQTGAELLNGDGDGYILQNGSSELVRFQAFKPCTDEELKKNTIEKEEENTTQNIAFTTNFILPPTKAKQSKTSGLDALSSMSRGINRIMRAFKGR